MGRYNCGWCGEGFDTHIARVIHAQDAHGCTPQPSPAPKPDDAVARARRLWQGIAWRDDLDAAGIIAAALRAERTRALEDAAKLFDGGDGLAGKHIAAAIRALKAKP